MPSIINHENVRYGMAPTRKDGKSGDTLVLQVCRRCQELHASADRRMEVEWYVF